MRIIKKFVVSSLILALGVSIFSGCSNKDASSMQKSVESSTTTGDEPFELTFMTLSYNGEPMKGEYGDKIMKMVEEYTNTKLDMEWVPSDSYDEKLTLALSSGKDMPHIIAVPALTPNIVSSAKAGAAWDVTDYIGEYPNLSQANPVINDNIAIDGRIYGIYRARILGRNGMGYRKDWADKLGLEEPETVEDVYNMLYAFTYNDPDGNGVDDTYGLEMCKWTPPFDIMQTWFNCFNGWGDDGTGKLVPVHQTEEYMEALQWFRKLYAEGLINPDFAVRDTANWSNDVKTGKAGMLVDTIDRPSGVEKYFKENELDAEMNLVGTIAKEQGGERHTLATTGNSGFFMITKAAKTEEEMKKCLDFLDKMNDDEMMMLADFGLKDVHYTVDENGFVTKLETSQDIKNAFYGLNQMVPYIPYTKAPSAKEILPPIKELEAQIMKENEKYIVSNPATALMANCPTYLQNGAALDKIIDDARTQYIVGQIDETGLKQAWELWLTTGGQNVIDEVNAQYQVK